MPHQLRLYLIALQFLTRIPVPQALGFQPEWLHQSARHFPGVGLLVGALGALVLWAAGHVFGAWIAVLLSMVATVWLTGAFHEDGLADTADALGGTVSRERALEIMKDSRIGTYGAVALLAVLALKAAALHELVLRNLHFALWVLPLVHCVSRLAPVALLRALPYAGDAEHAKAKPMAQQVGRAEWFGACAWAGAASALLIALGMPIGAALLAWAAAAAACAVMGRWLWQRLGGYTGDGLGATQQISELAMLLALVAAAAWGF
jgi:adenosylcobinamide-GDP ribazoletransferase